MVKPKIKKPKTIAREHSGKLKSHDDTSYGLLAFVLLLAIFPLLAFTAQAETIDSLGGWSRVSPTGSNPVYTYADSIGNVSISVSQQPLPSNFASNPASEVAALANNSGATRSINEGETKIFIGVSSNGRQSLF